MTNKITPDDFEETKRYQVIDVLKGLFFTIVGLWLVFKSIADLDLVYVGLGIIGVLYGIWVVYSEYKIYVSIGEEYEQKEEERGQT